MPDTPTFGRHAEIPVEKMTAEQQAGYRSLVDGPRGLGPDHCDRPATDRLTRHDVGRLEQLGPRVTLDAGTAVA
jgi:hypothetical protein